MTVWIWAGLTLLGGLGAVLRYLVDSAVSGKTGGDFPWGILIVNVSGSVLLGLVAGSALGRDLDLLAATALIGSYTTFSAWMNDSTRLLDAGRPLALVGNVGGSILLGVLGVAAGRAVTGLF